MVMTGGMNKKEDEMNGYRFTQRGGGGEMDRHRGEREQFLKSELQTRRSTFTGLSKET